METKKFEEKKVGSSIEHPIAKSYSSASGRFFHSGSHMYVQEYHGLETHCVYVCTLTVIGVFLFDRKATIICSSHDIVRMVA